MVLGGTFKDDGIKVQIYKKKPKRKGSIQNLVLKSILKKPKSEREEFDTV